MAKQQSSLSIFGLIGMASAGTGFIIAALLSVFLLQSMVNADHREKIGETLASELAQQVNIQEAAIMTLLEKLASSDIARRAIEGSTADLLAAESRLAAMIPHVARVRLVKLGEAKPDRGFPPLNFTSVDLIRKLEEGNRPAAEVISAQPQLEGEKWVIIAAPVTNSVDATRGTLFAHLSAKVLSQNVATGSSGEVRIVQKVGTEPKTVAIAGGEGSEKVYIHALNNPNWMIHYSPSPELASSAPGSLIIFLLPPIVMLLICLGGIFYSSKRSGASLDADLTTLAKQISRVATGHFDGDADYKLPGFMEPNFRLRELAKEPPPATTRPASEVELNLASKSADDDIVDIQMVDEDAQEIEEFEVDDFDSVVAHAASTENSAPVNPEIFRAYDIRGIVGETLSENIARQIGLAIGSEAESRGQQSLLVGFDGREYSPALAEALIDGLVASGRDVINIGSVPTPVLFYGTHNSSTESGVMVTGCQNSPDYNGFKIVLAGKTLVGEEIKALYERIASNNFSSGSGKIDLTDLTQDYMDAIADDVVVAQPLKVVVDCSNGIAGAIAPELLDALGCEPVPLYCDVDGSFPNHHPDPTNPKNLEDLILTVQSQGADLGIALDGDGDRIVAVTAEGDIVWPDRLLMLFARDIVSRNPGSDVVYDVKCTRHLNSVISGFGGRPIICRSGHSYIKQKLTETGALLGGELSGHICFSERWFGFDDGLYAAARLLEIVGSQEEGLADLLKEFPVSISTPEIHIDMEDSAKFDFMDTLTNSADFEDATITTIDGLRVDFADGWGLVRASNTGPALSLRFEADNEEALEDIKGAFRELIQEIRADLNFS